MSILYLYHVIGIISPYHPVEAHPKVFPQTLGLEEVEEDIHRGGMPEMVAKDTKRPYEGPTVGMQLCRSHVYLGQKSPLEPRERHTKFDPFEDGGVKKEEGFPIVRAFISAHGFTHNTRLYRHISIALSRKHTKHVSGLVLPMFHHVLTGSESRGLNKKVLGGPGVEGPVIYLGRRV